jgi:hypothetical protein
VPGRLVPPFGCLRLSLELLCLEMVQHSVMGRAKIDHGTASSVLACMVEGDQGHLAAPLLHEHGVQGAVEEGSRLCQQPINDTGRHRRVASTVFPTISIWGSQGRAAFLRSTL